MNFIDEFFDHKADSVKNGDNLRDVSPLKKEIDENGIIHYIFSKIMFDNPWYTIPSSDIKLFKYFLEGGARCYPSDGKIPCDIVAKETRQILNTIQKYAQDPNYVCYEEANKVLRNNRKSLVRGTLKLYLEKYTTRDWRRKRFTDDIDFWTFHTNILKSALIENGFVKNKKTKEWKKQVSWTNLKTDQPHVETIYAANDTNQLLDFGAGSYLEGASLKQIFTKKIKRGHDVDLSDIINVAMVNISEDTDHKEEWIKAWSAFEEAGNTRNTRTVANLISLCRYSLAIADHQEKISNAIEKYHDLIYDKSEYSEDTIRSLCKISVHWVKSCKDNDIEKVRQIIHDYILEQKEERNKSVKNLILFSKKILKLLNSKFKYQNIIFEIRTK
ncbi:MAG: hypothetical protein KGD63_07560 [Candidatus Lokiarchaeota archaeon]|nr:hypothetical protein [Candidatus Lokiarchaeota archaeon]